MRYSIGELALAGLGCLVTVAVWAALGALAAAVIWGAWDLLVPTLFRGPAISYLEACALYMVLTIVIGAIRLIISAFRS